MDFHIDNNDQTSAINCSSTAASPQAVLAIPSKTSTVEQTVFKIVEDLMDVVKIVTADYETPPKKMKKLMSVAANIQNVEEMITKELEVMEECIMSAEAKASIDDFQLESYDAILKILEDIVRI
uniref:S ribonuclease n=1 Tax=Panagrellus redivivus TaxID=6233 RepID=A0A7E4W107_PANRE